MNCDIEAKVDAEAHETCFSGVVEVVMKKRSFRKAWGFRDRANRVRNKTDTQFGIASGTKGFTALGVASLIEEGKLGM